MIAVVIPSKTSSNLLPCVAAVQEHQPGARIIVVDDGLETVPDGVEVISGAKPFCYARNCNLGIGKAFIDNASGIVLLNDDAILQSPNGFGIMAAAVEQNPKIGIVGATCNNVGNRAQWPQGVGLRAEPRMVCFVCAYVPRATLDRVGLLDERFIHYGWEDNDYCRRVRAGGLQIGIHDGCYVDHGSLRSSFRGAAGAGGDIRPNQIIYAAKWGSAD